MADFETYECANCGDEFKALPSSNAAENNQCCPGCATTSS